MDAKAGASPKLFHWDHITVARTSLVRGKVLKRKEEKRRRERETHGTRGEEGKEDQE